jgi:hypothetical protein
MYLRKNTPHPTHGVLQSHLVEFDRQDWSARPVVADGGKARRHSLMLYGAGRQGAAPRPARRSDGRRSTLDVLTTGIKHSLSGMGHGEVVTAMKEWASKLLSRAGSKGSSRKAASPTAARAAPAPGQQGGARRTASGRLFDHQEAAADDLVRSCVSDELEVRCRRRQPPTWAPALGQQCVAATCGLRRSILAVMDLHLDTICLAA